MGKLSFYQIFYLFRLKRNFLVLILFIFFIFIFAHSFSKHPTSNSSLIQFMVLTNTILFLYFTIFLNLDVMWNFINKEYEYLFFLQLPFKRERIFISRWFSLFVYFSFFASLFLLFSSIITKKIFLSLFIFSFFEIIILLNIITLFSFLPLFHFTLFGFILFIFVGTLLRGNIFEFGTRFKILEILFKIVGILLPPFDNLLIGEFSFYDIGSLLIYVFLLFLLEIFLSKKHQFL